MPSGEGRFAQVIIPSPLKEPLTYAIPPALQDQLNIGMRVLVPLGTRKVTGVVASLSPKSLLELKEIKEILACLDDRPILDASLMELSRWTSQYYLSTMGEVLYTVLPPGLRVASQKFVLQTKSVPMAPGLDGEILEELHKKKGKASLKTLRRRFPGADLYRAMERLVARGAVMVQERSVRIQKKERDDVAGEEETRTADVQSLTLTAEQQKACDAVQERLENGRFETFLLHGVTGSGKTEVYLRLMEEVRRSGRCSLILTPEISLTPQLLDRLRARFPGRVGVLHSALSPSQRWAEWWRILDGKVDVVVGARSAVFAPIPDLGLTVVDEEHDSSYKQEDGLRYHARDLAVVRGSIIGSPVLLGSATPSVESFENCRRGRYRLLELTKRVEQKPLPSVEVIDLRAEIRYGPRKTEDRQRVMGHQSSAIGLFSSRLKEALQENFRRSQQSLIFLNRRGFAHFLQCRLCGFVLRCSHCSVAMTFHLKQRAVLCHHCGFRKPAIQLCPGCGNISLSAVGFGTEQIEQELNQLLPEARVARMDRDTTRKRGSQERLIRGWEKGEIHVLVGTQMITKGHDIAGVTLVGAILADLSLNLPDFRAAEKTFQLLSQVAGRAGRGREPGRVIIQTYVPDHYTIQHVITHDYKGFFDSELEFRRSMSYPPFSRLVHLRLEGPKAQEVQAKMKELGIELGARQRRGPNTLEEIEILGPAPAPIEKLRGRYRWQILLKGKKSAPVLELARQARKIIPRSRHTRLYIDVDPYNML
ncbi:MAG TPA: primosomal protein N' [Candidatus Binatia bacterium]|nr:primosomal protein N' [Candidatus Binatia bacterium]